jgi:hypothetical protein
VQEQEIDSAVHRVESKFAQDVHHIRYSFEENWIGAPSVFFRIVVRDEASRGEPPVIRAFEQGFYFPHE